MRLAWSGRRRIIRRHGDVAGVAHAIAERFDALDETGSSDRLRTETGTAATCAGVDRNADDLDEPREIERAGKGHAGDPHTVRRVTATARPRHVRVGWSGRPL